MPPKKDKKNLFDSMFEEIGKYSKALQDELAKAFNPETIESQLLDLDEAASKLIKQFGYGRDNIVNINKAISESITDVMLLGGEWDDVYKIQQAVSSDLGRNTLMSNETVKSLYATSKVAGIEVGKMSGNFKDIGISASMVGKEMETVVSAAKSIGVSAQAVSSMAVDNLKRMNEFNFQGGVEGLAKMAAQAVNLRVDMKQTLNFAEKLFEPEKAIEMAAAMQRLGVAQGDLLDPLRLMDLAQNDPTELQNQIAQMTKQFVFMNEQGKFELFKEGKLRLREIAKELQIPYETLTNMALSGAEFEDKMSKIKFPDNAFSDDQQKFIANMAEMNNKGEYELKINGKVYGLDEGVKKLADSANSQTEEGQKLFNKFMEDQKPKSMEDLAKDQLSTLDDIKGYMKTIAQTGYSLGGSQLGTDILDAAKATSKSVIEATKTVNPLGKTTEQQSNTFDQIYEKGLGSITEILEGKTTFEEFVKNETDVFNTFKTNMENNVKDTLDDINKELDKLKENKNVFYEILKSVKTFITETQVSKGVKTNETVSNTKLPNYDDLKVEKERVVMNDIMEKDISDIIIDKYEPNNIALNNKKNTTPEKTTSDINVKMSHDFSNLPPNLNEEDIARILTKSISDQSVIQSIIQNIKMEQGGYGIGQQTIQPENSRFGYS